jgi:hypothetical protein
METDIHNLPLIPDDRLYYILAISFYECYDQLHNDEKFEKGLNEIMSKIFSVLKTWRESQLILDYPGDLK